MVIPVCYLSKKKLEELKFSASLGYNWEPMQHNYQEKHTREPNYV